MILTVTPTSQSSAILQGPGLTVRDPGGSLWEEFARFVDRISKKPQAADADSAREGRSFPLIDREIVEGVCRREPEALGRFFEHYFDRIFGLAYHLLGERASAEDATQEVFFKVLRAADQLDPMRDPAPWLITITLNTCRSYWRSAHYRMTRRSISLGTGPEPATEIPDDSRNPAEEVAITRRQQIVQEAIRSLPEKLRVVILLRDYQGLDHKQIAMIMDLNHDAVRKRYSRALVELARLLEGKVE